MLDYDLLNHLQDCHTELKLLRQNQLPKQRIKTNPHNCCSSDFVGVFLPFQVERCCYDHYQANDANGNSNIKEQIRISMSSCKHSKNRQNMFTSSFSYIEVLV